MWVGVKFLPKFFIQSCTPLHTVAHRVVSPMSGSHNRLMIEKINFNGFEWTQLKERAEQRLIELRLRNDSIELSEKDTLVLRGRILELKEFIDLPKSIERRSFSLPSDVSVDD